MGINVNLILKEAEEEIKGEQSGEAKKKLKSKLLEIERTKQILANQQAELKVLLETVGEELNG